jgi:hypothetical protein
MRAPPQASLFAPQPVAPPPAHKRLLLALNVVREAKRLPEVADRTKALVALVRGQSDRPKATFDQLLLAGANDASQKSASSTNMNEPLATKVPAGALKVGSSMDVGASSLDLEEEMQGETKGDGANETGEKGTSAPAAVTKLSEKGKKETEAIPAVQESGDDADDENDLGSTTKMFGAGMGSVMGGVGSVGSASFAMMPDVAVPGMGGLDLGDVSLGRLSTDLSGSAPSFSAPSMPSFSWGASAENPGTPF